MKVKKVFQARFHVGINVAGKVLTSIDSERDKAEMEITPVGVYAKIGKEERIIPFANIHQINVQASEK